MPAAQATPPDAAAATPSSAAPAAPPVIAPAMGPAAPPAASASPGLSQRLGLYTATMIVIGSVIGSGIFVKPATMAAQLRSPVLLLGIWTLAGLLTLAGALTNAEIAGMIASTGGQYVFFRRIYNDFVGYLYGWSVFSVIQTGSIASIAYVFAEYCGYFIKLPRLAPQWEQLSVSLLGGAITMAPFEQLGVKLLTVACILVLTSVNIVGVVAGGLLQNVLTTAKLAAIAAIAGAAFAFSDGRSGSLTAATWSGGLHQLDDPWGLLRALGLALAGAFWAYDGWNNITYVAGELREPRRTIPRSLLLGTATVVAIYTAINVAYLYVLPLDELARSELVAAAALERVLGHVGAAIVAALVVVSTFGTVNGTTLASARVSFAMARDGLFWRGLGHISPRFRTPARALVVQGLWASALVFSGTFNQLTDMLIFVSWIFYALGALGVFVLRRREPDAPRPYRVWGYPWVPAAFTLFAVGYVALTLRENPRDSLFGLLLVATGLPGYFYWRRRGAAAPA